MTSQIVAAIITALGSTIVGVSAVYFAWRSNRAMFERQRRASDETRLWEKRSDLYVGLLGLLEESSKSSESSLNAGEVQKRWNDIVPQLDAFGSELVRDKVVDWMFPENVKGEMEPDRIRSNLKGEIREIIRMELLQDLPTWYRESHEDALARYKRTDKRPDWR
ncbi:hypothetical protein ACIA5D_38200 [Actinoplanes sp. NPDC051513]|uniref:hypothetical protein n=1 Tax=Actinoplanes sp. NPDC051513 TaxID=3363908 RepID=UPI00378EBB2C